jgi:poly-gamma-glutamate synthesis protein (capsule biosynthesis protein)
VTTIDSAAYQLNWVYRTADSKKDYYIMPVETFEQDTTGFIADTVSRNAFTLFVKDSRALYGKHNVSVGERFIYKKEEEEAMKEENNIEAEKEMDKESPR